MKTKWNGREIGLLDVRRVDGMQVREGDTRLLLIGVNLQFEILTSDTKALRLLDAPSCEITRYKKQPADCAAVFKKSGCISPFGWRLESFTRKDWAEYPSPDHAWYSDIAECEIRLADKTTFRALVAVADTKPELRKAAGEAAMTRKAADSELQADAKKEKRASTSRRNGQGGGRKQKEPEKVAAAVREIIRRINANEALPLLQACRFYLKNDERSLPIKAERLAQLVRKARRRPSGKN